MSPGQGISGTAKWKLWRTWTTTSAPVTVCPLGVFSSSWQLLGPEGGPVSRSLRGPGTLLNPGKPTGAPFLGKKKASRASDTHTIRSINLWHSRPEPRCSHHWKTFSHFRRPHMRNQSVKKLENRGKNLMKVRSRGLLSFFSSFFHFWPDWSSAKLIA